MAKTVTSKQGTLQGRDWIRGLAIAIITSVLTIIVQTVEAGSLSFDWKVIGTTALAAGAAYLLKNLGEPTKTITIHDAE